MNSTQNTIREAVIRLAADPLPTRCRNASSCLAHRREEMPMPDRTSTCW
jgi:hypothetical protein